MTTKGQFATGAEYKSRNDDIVAGELACNELAFLANTTPEIIMELVDLDLIAPCDHSPHPAFRLADVQVVRKILRLQRHLQLSLDSMALVFDLMDRIAALEARIGEFEKE